MTESRSSKDRMRREATRPSTDSDLVGRRIAPGGRSGAEVGEVTYTVLLARDAMGGPTATGGPTAMGQERRSSPRQRTRLRSGKIVDPEGRFVTECLLHDLSPSGSRIRHPVGLVLPANIYLYDDQSGILHHAMVLWRKSHETGIRFKPQATASVRNRTLAAQMRRRFYAVPL